MRASPPSGHRPTGPEGRSGQGTPAPPSAHRARGRPRSNSWCPGRPSCAASSGNQWRSEVLEVRCELPVQGVQFPLELAVVQQLVDHLGLRVEAEVLLCPLELLGVDVEGLAHFASHSRSPRRYDTYNMHTDAEPPCMTSLVTRVTPACLTWRIVDGQLSLVLPNPEVPDGTRSLPAVVARRAVVADPSSWTGPRSRPR